MSVAYIALGANLSNPKATFTSAVADMTGDNISIEAVSSLWHSPAWPESSGHPDYVNAALKISTTLVAEALLLRLHAIEAKFGRARTLLNAPRCLDLDIIDYDGQVRADNPILPHPRATQRPFVLLPLLEIAEGWAHPITLQTPTELLATIPANDVLSHHVIERYWLNS